MEKNKYNFDAVLWDLDGTIVDTEYLHAKTEIEVLKQYGIDFSVDEMVKRFSGVKLMAIFETIFKENNVNKDYKEACIKKWKMMDEIIRQNSTNFMPGAKELLEKLYNDNIKMALATSSIKNYVDLIMQSTKIRDKFQFIITGEDVINGKPDPEIFIRAAEALNVNNEKCLVIEDGTAGVVAAQTANMKCLAVGDHIDKSILQKTNLYLESLENIDFGKINNLF